MTKDQIIRIAKHYADIGPTKLGEEMGVSKQYVQQMAIRLRKDGVNIPKLATHKPNLYKEALEELLK